MGLRFCARAFPSCVKRGPLFMGHSSSRCAGLSHYRGLSCWEHRLQTRRLSSCGSRAQLLRGMWDPPRPGLEPVSPALAGRLSTTAPPGKPGFYLFMYVFIYLWLCWVFVSVRGLSLVVASGGPLFYRGLSCCGAQAPEAQAQ